MKTTGLLLILMCAALLPVPAQDSTESSASRIRALERGWLEAQARNDNHSLDQIFDNALVYVEYGRLLSKSDYLSRIRTEGPHEQQIVMEPMTVRTFGSTAIVVGTYRERSTKNGKSPVVRWRFIDTWVYKKGSWVLVAAAAAPLAK
jgi:ketosteroid isomerase-like protein